MSKQYGGGAEGTKIRKLSEKIKEKKKIDNAIDEIQIQDNNLIIPLNKLVIDFLTMDREYNLLFVMYKGELYKRTGNCNICGNCCVALSSTIDNGKGICVFRTQKRCKIEENKPIQCKLAPIFPDDPALDLEQCGYNFKKIKEK